MTTLHFVPLGTLIGILVIFQFKHFVADFPLQGEYMLGKFKPDWDFIPPLASHCLVHALFTYWVTLVVAWSFWLAVGMAALDFTTHFIMDRIKAGPRYLGRFKPLVPDDYRNMKFIAGFKVIDKDGVEGPAPEVARAARRRLDGNKYFWWSLGFDQLVHHLNDYLIIYIILTYR